MNQYGAQLQRHWAKYRPQELAQIPVAQRETFFTDLGERIAREIQQTAQQLEAQHEAEQPTHGDYAALLAQQNTARLTAESEVLREHLMITETQDDATD